MPDLDKDSGEGFLDQLSVIATEDVAGLTKAYQSYGPSWKRRGGVGAYMMLARKWDRMEERLKKLERLWDIFHGIATDDRGEGLIDDVRDLRRYLMLVESEMRARGFRRGHRDNEPAKFEQRDTRHTCGIDGDPGAVAPLDGRCTACERPATMPDVRPLPSR